MDETQKTLFGGFKAIPPSLPMAPIIPLVSNLPTSHFSDEEKKGLLPLLIFKLEKARTISGIPYIITSGFRTPEHNAEIGGVSDSAHTTGEAVDLLVQDDHHRYLMLVGLLDKEVGFKRIEIAPNHIHVDISKTKPNEIVWLGKDNG